MEGILISGGAVFTLILVGLVIVVVFKGVNTVPQGFQFTVERFGRFTGALTPGLNLIIPFVEIGRAHV